MLTPENVLPQKQMQKLVVLLKGVVLGLVKSDSTLRFQCQVMILSPDKTALEKELEQENPRKDMVQALMRKTFSSWREYILESSDSVEVLLSMYKGFSLPYCVS